MVLGMSLPTFTFLHVLMSLIGIVAGFVMVIGLIGGKLFPRWTGIFFIATALTILSGFLFPYKGFTPAIGVGVLSLLVLLLAIIARYVRHLAGAWRSTYVITAILALYFNFFVLIVQSFEKIPALKALAPTQSEPPFKLAQLATLVLFVVLTTVAYRRFRAA
ncbi:MAG: hypothetical protein WB608_19905 [Terracidiphilus sp.]